MVNSKYYSYIEKLLTLTNIRFIFLFYIYKTNYKNKYIKCKNEINSIKAKINFYIIMVYVLHTRARVQEKMRI